MSALGHVNALAETFRGQRLRYMAVEDGRIFGRALFGHSREFVAVRLEWCDGLAPYEVAR